MWAHKDGHPDNVTTISGLARAGREYRVHAACLSTTPGKVLSVEVRSGKPGASDQVLAAADVPCDGTVAVDSLSNLPAEPLIIDLQGGQADVSSAYALVAPTPALSQR
ncbi:hypothetical protein Q0Z83_026890 [Actinoplanes sichuanensis]|nr:hypothetical protein Q0Z83_026890 [Actinoplanes sichuanensis]